jgi:hypothetical protein
MKGFSRESLTIGSRDSVVSIVMGYGLDDRGVGSYPMGIRDSFPRGKVAGV